ncbi:MAG: 50S ribosomal protein L9, partial [Lachnospiraceae bacterium]
TKETAAAIKEQLGYEIDKKKISLDVPVKSPGTYNLAIKLHPKVTGGLKVVVQEA